MGYKRAEEVLPQDLIEIIQKYVDGESIYIPRKEGERKEWGSSTAARRDIAERDGNIYADYNSGLDTYELAEKYYLSTKSIQRILRKFK